MGGLLTSRVVSDLLLGLQSGVITALVALSLVIIWQSSTVLNFAQGAMAMFASYVGLTQLEHHLNYWLCFVVAIVVGMAFGGTAEWLLIRPLRGKPEVNPIVVMVGLLGLIETVAAAIWGQNSRIIPSPFSQIYWVSGGKPIDLSPYVVFQLLSAGTLLVGVGALFRYTKLGLQLRASALAPEVARLLGVRVNRMRTLGWVISAGVAAFAAVIVASGSLGLYPSNMDGIFIAGFIAAAVGGLESPLGAVVAGIGLGIVEQFSLDYGSVNLAPIVGVVILLVVLMIRPQGLFQSTKARRV
jgi:branched-chain amino acid transport system permease protein